MKIRTKCPNCYTYSPCMCGFINHKEDQMPLKVEYAIGPQREITLEEVRDLVETTKDWDGNTRVNIKIFEGDQCDPTTSSITVRKP